MGDSKRWAAVLAYATPESITQISYQCIERLLERRARVLERVDAEPLLGLVELLLPRILIGRRRPSAPAFVPISRGAATAANSARSFESELAQNRPSTARP